MSSEQKLNLLVAYPYLKKDVIELIKYNQKDIRFLLDSGAFTAWKAGKPIALDDYCRFIESLPFEPWRYFTLDVIGNPHASMQNYETMLKRGFKPVPIFTRGEDPSVLEDYYKTSEVVGIGGLVGTRGNKGFVKGIMNKVKGRKVHWLGFNSQEFIAHYKPYMCDSSSWSCAFRFGAAQIYEKNGRWIHINKKMFSKRPDSKIMNLINEHGIDSLSLAKTESWRNVKNPLPTPIIYLTTRTFAKYQKDLKEKLGTLFFLACGQFWEVNSSIEAFHFWRNKN